MDAHQVWTGHYSRLRQYLHRIGRLPFLINRPDRCHVCERKEYPGALCAPQSAVRRQTHQITCCYAARVLPESDCNYSVTLTFNRCSCRTTTPWRLWHLWVAKSMVRSLERLLDLKCL